jgi:hypothetical protein
VRTAPAMERRLGRRGRLGSAGDGADRQPGMKQRRGRDRAATGRGWGGGGRRAVGGDLTLTLLCYHVTDIGYDR